MPELPEVETVVRDVRPLLVGRRLTAIESGRKALRKPWKKSWNKTLLNQTITAVERRGKWIVCHLDGERRLVFHLGMSGQLKVQDADAERESHTHLVFDLDDGRQLRFRDYRRFGSVTLYEMSAELEKFFAHAKLGPEPFTLDADYWRQQLAKTSRSLKAVLLDQRVVAGVGNIYADEMLFQSETASERFSAGHWTWPRPTVYAPPLPTVPDAGHRAARFEHPQLRWRRRVAGRVSARVSRLRP